ncbi:MAG: glycolate oxidase subunit GlcE [Pseudomonadota bacterium]
MVPDTDSFSSLVSHVREAATRGTVLRIRGGGSKDFYGESPQGETLEVGHLTGIVSYEPSELVVTVRAGTPLAELEAVLAQQGQCLPFEPPRFAGATVGGMVASGLAGPSRASAGGVRDYMLGIVMLNGKAEVLTFGGQVMKNVAGYDLSRLMAGSMGTLGVLLEVSLKVLPVAPGEATLMCAGLPQQQALDLLNRWGGQPLPLNASCWVRDTAASPPDDYLFVRLRGAVAAIEAACPRMVANVQAAGGKAVRMDNAQAAQDWTACREQSLPFFAEAPDSQSCLWRLSVPQTAPALDLPWPQFIEWHGGLRWLWAPLSSASLLRERAAAAGGHASVFRRGPNCGVMNDVPAFTPLPAVQQRIQSELQRQFDPAGVFRTGRLQPALG